MITAHVEGLEKLQRGLAGAPSTLASETRTAMTTSLLLIESTARPLAPRATGRLAGSISHTITGAGADLTGRVGPSVAYGFYVEKGRLPGRPPPIAAIAGWARSRGMGGGGRNARGQFTTNSAAFLIARAIGRKGIRPRPFLVPAFERQQSAIVAAFRKVGLAVVSRIAS